MIRNFSLFASLFAFSFFAPAALAESVGCGDTCTSTTTQSAETDESIGGGMLSLSEWFFGGSQDTSE